jgi:hypothetical protein
MAMAGLCVGACTSANAALYFELTTGNDKLSGGTTPPPYGLITLALAPDGYSATVTLSQNGSSYVFGDGATIALNLASSTTTFDQSTLSWTARPGDAQPPSLASVGANAQTFGSFNFGITMTDGYGQSVTSLSFKLLNGSSTAWGTESDILAANNEGWEVMAHAFNVGGTITGYATGTGTPEPPSPTVPEPTTILAGALLLLPFGASTIRILRRK